MALEGKRILITGAAGGLGVATTRALRKRGAQVVGIDLKKDATDDNLIEADVRDPAALKRAVEAAVQRLGGLDVLINNAGVLDLQDPGQMPGAAVDDALAVHLYGPWRATAAALPALLESGGRVINVASLFAAINAPFIPAYAASKRALAAYSDILRIHYGGKITVTTVYPGYLNTPIHDKAVRQGLSVAALVTFKVLGIKVLSTEESLPAAGRAIANACDGRPVRHKATSALGSVALFLARHTPVLVDWFISTRVAYLIKRGLRIELDSPESAVAVPASSD